jgi:hypothetical protein
MEPGCRHGGSAAPDSTALGRFGQHDGIWQAGAVDETTAAELAFVLGLRLRIDSGLVDRCLLGLSRVSVEDGER